jgi:hypothetical protein
MFGLFKQEVSASAVALMAMNSAVLIPSELQTRIEPFEFEIDQDFIFEAYAFSYAVTIIGIQRSPFGPADAHRICAEFTGLFTDFITKRVMEGAKEIGLAANSMQAFFQERYMEYRQDTSEAGIAAAFLAHVHQKDHPTIRSVVAAMVYAGANAVTENMTKIAKKAKLR